MKRIVLIAALLITFLKNESKSQGIPENWQMIISPEFASWYQHGRWTLSAEYAESVETLGIYYKLIEFRDTSLIVIYTDTFRIMGHNFLEYDIQKLRYFLDSNSYYVKNNQLANYIIKSDSINYVTPYSLSQITTSDISEGSNQYFLSSRARSAVSFTQTDTLDFDLTALSYQDINIDVSGVEDGDAVSIGVPNDAVVADVTYFGWVSATDIVTIRCSRVGGGGAANPASGIFRVSVFRY